VEMNITKLTESYLQQHPFVKECLKKGLINYSSLARQICNDLGLEVKKNFDAVLIACRRYRTKIEAEASKQDRVLAILRQSKVEVKNKIAALVLENSIHMPNLLEIERKAKNQGEVFHIIEGISAITVITSEDFLPSIKSAFRNSIIRENKMLAEITLKSPIDIETTPGLISYLYSLFGENNINIFETMSCWTDTIFVIEEKDIARVMGLLRF
jgi:hypothetical protein